MECMPSSRRVSPLQWARHTKKGFRSGSSNHFMGKLSDVDDIVVTKTIINIPDCLCMSSIRKMMQSIRTCLSLHYDFKINNQVKILVEDKSCVKEFMLGLHQVQEFLLLLVFFSGEEGNGGIRGLS